MTDRFVVAASALLAMLQREPGTDAVAMILATSVVSALNWSEVVQKARSHGVDVTDLEQELTHLGVEFASFTTVEASVAADLWHRGARSLALADRACIATAKVRGLPVVTADRAWASLNDIGVLVRVIR
ncbi:MAG: type II toxin-antitoxin system VapC family toxin [Chloroflexi bacterium]|nr:type II toxin-antitoxin system VapC family toxin [Chloroflexota bacterium]